MSLWGRQVAVQIGLPGQTGVSISELRVSFDVKHDRTKNPAEAAIDIYNPRRELLAALEDSQTLVRLFAGYSVPRQVFQGNPIKDGVRMVSRGGDRILTIEAKDGLRAYQDTVVDISFATETTLAQVFEAVREALGLPLGVSIELDRTRRFPSFRYSGPAHVLLDRLAAMSGSDWQIRDGTLVIITEGDATGEPAPLYSAEAGTLVSSPTRREKGAVDVTVLLDNTMRPGRAFRLVSEYVSGDFVAETVRFVGDSGFSSQFYAQITGKPRPRSQPTLGTGTG